MFVVRALDNIFVIQFRRHHAADNLAIFIFIALHFPLIVSIICPSVYDSCVAPVQYISIFWKYVFMNDRNGEAVIVITATSIFIKDNVPTEKFI